MRASRPVASPVGDVPYICCSGRIIQRCRRAVRRGSGSNGAAAHARHNSSVVDRRRRRVPFRLVSDSSRQILMGPSNTSLTPIRVLGRFQPNSPTKNVTSCNSCDQIVDSPRRGFRNRSGRHHALKCHCHRSIVPIKQSLAIIKVIDSHLNDLAVRRPGSGRPFVVSPRSRRSLAGTTLRGTHVTF